jgi:protein SCO1/2
LMYFGYTSCPDVCPTTMADVRSALEALGPDAERVSVAMATVDPERDTAEVLDGYLRFFVPERSHVLRTEDFGQLHEAEQVFGASSALTPEADGEGYDVEHTGTLYVIDGEGRLVLEWPFGSVNFEQITDDLRQVLEVS